jgi:outer membrane protein assembly factor BamD (BamD/ComL family)
MAFPGALSGIRTEVTLGKRKRITKKGLKHDALLETTAKGTKFIEDHLNKVLIGLAAVVVVVIVVGMVVRGQRSAEIEANADLMRASQSASAGMLAQAAQEYQAVIDLHPGTRSAGAATCYLGTILYMQQQYDAALTNFQTYLDRYGNSGNLGKVALEGKASVLEQRRDFAAAAEIYRELAEQSRALESTSARYLADAMRCHRSANDWEAVRDVATEIVEQHGETSWAGDARTSLAEANAFIGS